MRRRGDITRRRSSWRRSPRPRWARTIFIEAPPAKVFGYLMDPRNLPEIGPSMVEISNVQGDRHIAWRTEGGIRGTFHWTLTPHDDGTEALDEVEYELPPSLLTRLAAPFVRRIDEHEADLRVQNLKPRMETPDVVA